MKDQNSYAEFILGTLHAQLVDCASQYPELTKEFNRDFERLNSAIERHGIRFALDTMPAYRKHFDKCLDERRLTASHLIHFGVGLKQGTVPRLFRGLVLRVFDSTGALRSDMDVEAVRWIRQLLGVVRKLRMTSNVKDTANAVIDFFHTDLLVKKGTLNWDSDHDFDDASDKNDLSFEDHNLAANSPDQLELLPTDNDSTVPSGLLKCVQQVADLLTSQLGVFDPLEWRPRHGPGAVSDQDFGSYRYDFKNWPDRLERVFPYADIAVSSYQHVVDHVRVEDYWIFHKEYPSKLCAVPKTLSKPRLIASEPVSNQWCQQILRHFFYDKFKTSSFSSFVDFRRQDKNGALALKASREQSHATIDLSSASDRVSCWHVERLFRRSPSLLRALQSSRTTWIKQGICRVSPRYYYLRKYSTMGNATTFPVQSALFLCLALGTLCYHRGLKVSNRVISELGEEQVRVFGDDIIIPADCSALLVELIQALGLQVNTNKTFTKGNFRESCGVDAFQGHDVTTVGILDVPKRASPGSIVSSVDVHHNLCERGYIATAAFIQKTAGRVAFNKIRFVKHGSGLFGWSSMFGQTATNTRIRHNRNLHRGEVQCLKLKVSEQRLQPNEPSGLLQYFIEAPNKVTSAVSTLNYLTQRPKVGLSLGWAMVD